jgi:hypothetical protein
VARDVVTVAARRARPCGARGGLPDAAMFAIVRTPELA